MKSWKSFRKIKFRGRKLFFFSFRHFCSDSCQREGKSGGKKHLVTRSDPFFYTYSMRVKNNIWRNFISHNRKIFSRALKWGLYPMKIAYKWYSGWPILLYRLILQPNKSFVKHFPLTSYQFSWVVSIMQWQI